MKKKKATTGLVCVCVLTMLAVPVYGEENLQGYGQAYAQIMQNYGDDVVDADYKEV